MRFLSNLVLEVRGIAVFTSQLPLECSATFAPEHDELNSTQKKNLAEKTMFPRGFRISDHLPIAAIRYSPGSLAKLCNGTIAASLADVHQEFKAAIGH